MIRIKDLNISFDSQKVFDQSEITIRQNEVTVIYGESGSGKSTLLNVISLEMQSDAKFNFNGIDIQSLSNEEKKQLKKDHIVYIHQDDTFIRKYSLKENAILMLESKGQEFDEDQFTVLLEKVGIPKKKINKPLKNLSNGERQRFAIVCSMMIDAWLYIYDEPTSSLNQEYARKVIDLIQTQAKNNKMVLVSLHDRSLIKEAHIYELKNHKINELQETQDHSDQEYSLTPKTMKSKLIFKEGMRHLGSHPWMNTLSILVLSIVLTLSCLLGGYGSQLVEAQEDTLENIYDSELFVINGNSSFNDEAFLKIEETDVEVIKNLEHVKNVYPHLYLRQNNFYYGNNMDDFVMMSEDKGSFDLVKDGSVAQTVVASDLYMQYVQIDPVYPHQKFQERCEVYDESIEKGFYISSDLAQTLGLKELNGEALNIKMTVPIASQPMVRYDTDNTETFQRGMVCGYKEIELPIKGILKKTTVNQYTLNVPKIFLDYNVIQEIMDEVHQEKLDLIEDGKVLEISSPEIAKYWSYSILDDPWESSAYIVEVDSIENVEQVLSEIQAINPSFTVRGMQVNGQMTNDVIGRQKTIVYAIEAALVIVLIVLSLIIKKFKNKRNHEYYQYLSRLGFKTKSINQIIRIETIGCLIIVSIFVIMLLLIVYPFIRQIIPINTVVFGVFIAEIIGVYLLSHPKYQE